ncbi:MAG: hypothetical protein WD875_12785 [Pirellulales bacterium]
MQAVSNAAVIETLYSTWDGTDTISPFDFGSLRGQYYAQTFEALPGLAMELTFAMRDRRNIGEIDAGYPMRFRVLLAETIGSASDPDLSTIIFESSALSLPDGSNWTTFTVNLGGIDLMDGSTYAWVLDAYSDFVLGMDGGAASVAYIAEPQAGGHAMFLNADNDGHPRSTHFANGVWADQPGSMAFELTFDESHVDQPLPQPPTLPPPLDDIPEPASVIVWALLVVVGTGLAWRQTRRSDRRNC